MTTTPSTASVLKNRTFLRLWAAQAVSMTAQSMVNFAVIVLTERVTQRSIFTSIAILCFSIPPILVGAFAGVVVDRANKARVLWITNFLRAVLMVGFFAFDRELPTGLLLAGIFSLTAIFAVISQFFGPAEAATIPLVVPREQLLAANALFATTYNAALVGGLAILGPLFVKVLGLQTLWLCIGFFYAICVILVTRLPAAEQAEGQRLRDLWRSSDDGLRGFFRREFWQPVREVWLFMARHAAVRAATINLSLAATILLVVATLGPGFVSRTLGRDPEDVSLLLLPASIGMLTGIFTVGRVVARTGAQRLISFSMVAGGIFVAGLALSPQWGTLLATWLGLPAANVVIAGLVVMAFGMGVVNSFVTIPANTQLQEETDESMRGRVFASLFMIIGTLSMLPVLFAGVLADWLGIVNVMILVGVVMLVGGLITINRRQATTR